ncbi:MAG: metal-dependent hydrolase [Phycisphaerales bacterium]|jgi:membrane-bound metal-dependent hydrolase YbcI (DUF457 family)
MPFTPYHFGLHGFVGLVFKKWLDLPVLVLANVIIDAEVLFRIEKYTGPLTHWNFPHRVFHFHTLLVGGFVGILFGLAMFPLRGVFKRAMNLFKLSYSPTALKMAVSGLLGALLHILVDGMYHWDVQMFWPDKNARPLWNILTQNQVRELCIAFWFLAIALYVVILAVKLRKRSNAEKPVQ